VYKELYEAWSKEKENEELQQLPRDFYAKLADYIRRLREESRMLDEKTTKARLSIRESKNVQKMVKELITLRQQKSLRKVLAKGLVHSEELTREEEKLLKEVTPSFESFQAITNDILIGRLPQAASKKTLKKRTLRFIKETPAIIGADMKTYGPFRPEDVASIPKENARILVKQGVAAEIES